MAVRTPVVDESGGNERQYRGPIAAVLRGFAAALALFCLLYTSGVLSYFKVYFLEHQFNAIFLAGVLLLVFLWIPVSKSAATKKLPWYDVLFILAGLAGTFYIIINALELTRYFRITASPVEIGLSVATLLVLMEAVRRTLGWSVVIIAAIFIIYAKFGYLLPGVFSVYPFTWGRVMNDVYLSAGGIFGSLTSVAAGVILAFVVFGIFFTRVGAGEFLFNLAMSLVGGVRGGAAKAAIVGSALFGTISGSPIANVSVVGTITIPMMKSAGYEPKFAGAVESVASTGGAIMPPVMGAVAFVMANMLGVSYSVVAAAAAIPAVLYYLALFVQTDLRAAKDSLKGVSRKDLPSMRATLKKGWQFLIPLVLLVVFLFVMRYSAETSALYTIVAVILLDVVRRDRRLNPKSFVATLEAGMRSTLPIAAVCGLAGVFLGVLGMTGLGPRISSGLVSLASGNSLALLLLAAVASYIMGMGVSAVATYILLAVLVAPALEAMGVPLIAGHFFVFYMGMSTFFTPPYAPAVFVAAPIAGASIYGVGFQAMKLGIVTFLVPISLAYNPVLLLRGSVGEIIVAFITAVIGIIGLSVGLEGYLFARLNWVMRVLAALAGFAMFLPGAVTDFVGGGVLALVLVWHWLASRTKGEMPASLNNTSGEGSLHD